MKLNGILLIILGAAMVAFFGIGCCCGGGGDSDFDFDELEDFGEDLEDLGDTGTGGTETQTGYISGPGTEQEFGVYATSDPLELTFSWDGGMDPYCKVLGMNRNPLGTFRLADGEIIELTGGGQFYIIVGSYSGSGNWTCVYSQ
ncbi:MAG: hypothetical protein GY771_16870 [bacterium]|nr:hypothetical protein [bacterium]